MSKLFRANKCKMSKLFRANKHKMSKTWATMDQMAERRWCLRARSRMYLKELAKGRARVKLKLLLEEVVAVQDRDEADRWTERRIGRSHPQRRIVRQVGLHRLREVRRAATSRTTT